MGGKCDRADEHDRNMPFGKQGGDSFRYLQIENWISGSH